MKKASQKTARFSPVLKSFNCRSCGATLDLKAVGISVSVSCPSCHVIIDATNPNYKILEKAKKTYKFKKNPSIPIGSRGKLSGKTYEVIGFMERMDGIYPWKEYLLYNPYIGFRWLFEMNGHWSFVKRLRTLPREQLYSSAQYKKKTFKLFNAGEAKVTYVEGEFYWRVKIDDYSKVWDYISPPYMLSKEVTKDESIWTLSTYITPKRLESVFHLEENSLIKPYGIAPNQPSPSKANFKRMFGITVITLLTCLLLQLGNHIWVSNTLLYQGPINLNKERLANSRKISTKFKLVKIPEFEIKQDKKNIKLRGHSAIYNNWIYLDALLVNSKTGKGIPIPLEISHYKGSDWSEGSQTNDTHQYNIPKGTYYLSIQPQSGNFRNSIRLGIELISDVSIFSNFYWILFLLLTPLLTVGVGVFSFEKKRWKNGSENPYGE